MINLTYFFLEQVYKALLHDSSGSPVPVALKLCNKQGKDANFVASLQRELLVNRALKAFPHRNVLAALHVENTAEQTLLASSLATGQYFNSAA